MQVEDDGHGITIHWTNRPDLSPTRFGYEFAERMSNEILAVMVAKKIREHGQSWLAHLFQPLAQTSQTNAMLNALMAQLTNMEKMMSGTQQNVARLRGDFDALRTSFTDYSTKMQSQVADGLAKAQQLQDQIEVLKKAVDAANSANGNVPVEMQDALDEVHAQVQDLVSHMTTSQASAASIDNTSTTIDSSKPAQVVADNPPGSPSTDLSQQPAQGPAVPGSDPSAQPVPGTTASPANPAATQQAQQPTVDTTTVDSKFTL